MLRTATYRPQYFLRYRNFSIHALPQRITQKLVSSLNEPNSVCHDSSIVYCGLIEGSRFLRQMSLYIDNASNLVFWCRFLNKLEPWHIVYILQQ